MTKQNKFFLLLLLAAFLGFTANAQDDSDAWMRAEGSLEGFVNDKQYYTFVTDANLREKPGTQSKAIAQLPIGTAVTVLEVAIDSFSLRGIKMPWLKVRCQPKGAGQTTGYVWGGFMALASIQTPSNDYIPNSGVLYLTGVSAFNEAKHEISIQVRASKEGKELAKTEFKTNGNLSYYPAFELHNDNLNGVKAILSVNYYYPACGYPSGNNLLFWSQKNQLLKVLETSSVSEGGVFYSSEEFILPAMRGGIGDHVVVINDFSSFTEKGNDLVREKQKWSLSVHKWDGAKLLKVKELK